MFIKDRNVIVILIVFAVVHVILYLHLGVNKTLEAEKYIYQADLLLKQQFPSAFKYYFYLPIIVLIALVKKLSFNYIFVILAQSLIAAIGLVFYYKGTAKIFSKPVSLLASLALCCFLPYSMWDFYLYSDSLFISFCLIFYYLICRFEDQEVKTLLLIFALLVMLLFTRPFGVLFIPPLLLYFFFAKFKNQKIKWLTVTLSLLFSILMFFIINLIFHGGEDMNAMKPFIEEHIICFVPNNPHGATLNLKYYNNGVQDILYYIVHNPVHFLSLMLKRVSSFFILSRPWYSTSHNLLLLAYTIPVYILFLVGTIRIRKERKNAPIFFFSLIILYSLAVTFQCNDWHGRFTMPILPYIFAIASFGFFSILNNLKMMEKVNKIQ